MSNSAAGKYFEIKADSIVSSTTDNVIIQLILFKPTKATLNRLRNLTQGEKIGMIRLIDKWDDGTLDTHYSDRQHSFVGISGSGLACKTKAYTLTLAVPNYALVF